MLAGAFAAVAALGPLALAVSLTRTGYGTAMHPAAAHAGAASAVAILAGAATIAAVLLGGLGLDVVRLRRVKGAATQLGRLGVRGAVLGSSRAVGTPTAVGYLHPAVLVPVDFRDRVDAREWDAVLAHECAHLARGDDWAKALQSAVVRVAWWMPGLWVLANALDLERELASDEQAAGAMGWRDYAACLLRLAGSAGRASAPAFAARRAHVAIRVERLLRPVPHRSPLLRAACLGIASAAALAVAAAAVLAVPGARPAPASREPSAHAAAHARAVIVRHRVAHRPPRKRRLELALRAPSTAKPAGALPAQPPSPATAAPRAAHAIVARREAERRPAPPPAAVAFAPARRYAAARGPSGSADVTVAAGGRPSAPAAAAGGPSLLADAAGMTAQRPDMTRMPIRAFVDL